MSLWRNYQTFKRSLQDRLRRKVTSIKQLVDRWYPNMPRATKPAGHRALDDIRGSIAELQYYRENVFRELS